MITQITLALWLALAYDLLEDRRRIDIIVAKLFPLCFNMVERFENLDNILREKILLRKIRSKKVLSEKYSSSPDGSLARLNQTPWIGLQVKKFSESK